jgi:Ca2+-dependent lipid-binding protein
MSGVLAKKARLEVLLDDGYWPCFTTIKSRSTEARWEHVGEGFIKEVDFSRVWLRLNEAEEGDKDDIIAEWKGDAKPFLQSALVSPRDDQRDCVIDNVIIGRTSYCDALRSRRTQCFQGHA